MQYKNVDANLALKSAKVMVEINKYFDVTPLVYMPEDDYYGLTEAYSFAFKICSTKGTYDLTVQCSFNNNMISNWLVISISDVTSDKPLCFVAKEDSDFAKSLFPRIENPTIPQTPTPTVHRYPKIV